MAPPAVPREGSARTSSRPPANESRRLREHVERHERRKVERSSEIAAHNRKVLKVLGGIAVLLVAVVLPTGVVILSLADTQALARWLEHVAGRYWVHGLVAFGVLVVSLVAREIHRSPERRARRIVERAELRTVAQAQDGEVVKLLGSLTGVEEPMSAPFTGRRCAIYRALVEYYYTSRDSSGWNEKIREEDAREFFLADETGRARVQPALDRMRFLVASDFVEKREAKEEAPTPIEAFLARYGDEPLESRGTRRYREAVLKEGDRVAVVGRVRWQVDAGADPTADYRSPPKRLVVEAPDGANLIVTDAPSRVGGSPEQGS